MSNDTTPGELHAINTRLDQGDARFAALERSMLENTRITAESAGVLIEVRDALIFARVGTRIIKWLGALGAVVATAATLWQAWRKP